MQTREELKETIVAIIKDSFPSVVRREFYAGNQVDIYLSDEILGKCADKIADLFIIDRERIVEPLYSFSHKDINTVEGIQEGFNKITEAIMKTLKNAGIE